MEYGKCPCGGTYDRRQVEVRMRTAEPDPVVASDIPQGACQLCGSRVYKAQILDMLETMWRPPEAPVSPAD